MLQYLLKCKEKGPKSLSLAAPLPYVFAPRLACFEPKSI